MGGERDANGGNNPGVMPARSPVRQKTRQERAAAERQIREASDREREEERAIKELDLRTKRSKSVSTTEMMLNPVAKVDAVVGSFTRNQIADRIRRGGKIVRSSDNRVVGVVEEGKGLFGQDVYTGQDMYNPIAYGRKNAGVKQTKYGYTVQAMSTTGSGGGSATSPAAGGSSPAPSPTLASAEMSGGARRRSVTAARAAGAARRQFLG